MLSDLKNAGKEIILVTSGAIGVGAGKLGMRKRPSDMPTKQACAALGQSELMYVYDKCFSEYNHNVAQVLLTRDIIEDARRKENVTNTLSRLLSLSVIPVINENDTVSTEEIEFGDNDTLSAIVSSIVQADLLIILTDIDGLYDSDPHENPAAKRIPHVRLLDSAILAAAGSKGSEFGTRRYGGKAARGADLYGSEYSYDYYERQPSCHDLRPARRREYWNAVLRRFGSKGENVICQM